MKLFSKTLFQNATVLGAGLVASTGAGCAVLNTLKNQDGEQPSAGKNTTTKKVYIGGRGHFYTVDVPFEVAKEPSDTSSNTPG
ncbi:MAG: hypothetical protein K0U37_07760 [Gammaproteobacteria bacterium]|nr:hypothetical protein [Gammaproteobacteria bacterium]